MSFSPLKHKLRSVISQEVNRAQALAATKDDMAAIHRIVEPMVDSVIELVRGITEIYERSGQSVRRLGEIDPGETADKLADIRLMLDHLEMLHRLEYVDLATRLSVIEPELAAATVEELAHLPEGMAKLELFYKAIQQKLTERVS